MTEEQTAVCWSCGEALSSEANWCEACGESAEPPPDPCVSCGADGTGIEDGYCGTCGHKQPHPRDHLETDLGTAATVTNKGKRHHHNEDAFAMSLTDPGIVLVVCDGVSSTLAPETASQAAADAGAATLANALDTRTDLVEAFSAATAAAQQAVVDTPPTKGHGDPPSCTFVGVVAASGSPTRTVTVGWLGDSRAYLVTDTAVTQLTLDDSWAEVQVASGELSRVEADADPRAHSITRWIGQDASDVIPRTATIEAATGDVVLVCSDGLWNYAPTEQEMFTTIDAQRQTEQAPLAVARRLVQFALDSGGHDNVTVAWAVL